MTIDTTSPLSTRLRLDGKRRALLSPALLEAADLAPGADLVARVDGPGRIVLESPDTMLARLQEAARRGKAIQDQARRDAGEDALPESVVDDLLAERARDTSLDDLPPSP